MSDPQQPLPPPIVSKAPTVQPLEYTPTPGSRRPGILTAIGILSIVLSVPGIAYSLLIGFQAVEHYHMVVASTRPAWRPPVFTAATSGSPAPGGQATTDPAAAAVPMQPAERAALIDAMTKRKPLSPKRRRQLDALLAAAGTKLGADTIKWRGTVPGTAADESDGDAFTTGGGHVEVYDNRAIFMPTYGRENIRVFAPEESSDTAGGDPAAKGAEGAAATSTATGPGGLPQAEIQEVIQQVDAQAKASNPNRFGLTPKQVATLQSLLAAPPPGQELVRPGTAQSPIVGCNNDMSGRVRIEFSNGSTLVLEEKGTVASRTGPAPVVPPFSTSPTTIMLLIAMTVVSLGLAIWLLAAGILMLRRSPRARRLHLTYAWLKLPAAAALGVCYAYVTYGITNDQAAGAGQPSFVGYPRNISWDDALAIAARPAALGCLYPVALLIVLNTAAVRRYYRPAPAEA